MTEMNSHNPDHEVQKEVREQQDRMDNLLRRTMSPSAPTLRPDFDQRVLRGIRRASGVSRYHRNLLSIYTLISVIVCASLMWAQGLSWAAIAAMIVVPLGLVAAVNSIRNGTKKSSTANR